MPLAGAARNGLGAIDLVENLSHRETLVDELGDERFASVAEFLEGTVVCLPVYRIEEGCGPAIMFSETLEDCWSRGRFA